ncbi:DUF1045 domain-containing protein [Pseudooceanicola sp. MF1-13]|uniref:DUF1045 domain-containing protein n=1 Tax=Pseudooceanicola sp. MF1-13 TaxID=3379095 RepID=UPI00389175B3
MNYSRYAIYYVPAPGPLMGFTARWLGWDVLTGSPAAHPDLPVDVAAITATPRKYGFHGTIKPPFHLAEGSEAGALLDAARLLCATLPPVTLEGLELSRIGRFIALTPVGDTDALATLAATCVRNLDRFRAPPSEAELARRRQANLSPRQETLLDAWGYPYVMEEFRFHMTLSGRLNSEKVGEVIEVLRPELSPWLGKPYRIDALALVGERTDKHFELIDYLPLGG